jgi:hypothetical protein
MFQVNEECLHTYFNVLLHCVTDTEGANNKYLFMSHHHNGGHNHNVTTANKSFENVAKLKAWVGQYLIKITFNKKLSSD